jgi:hypothetical protein
LDTSSSFRLKTVNTATFSRMEKAIDRIRRLLAVPRSSPTVAPNPSAGPTPDTSGAVTGEEVEDDQKQTGEKGQEGQLSSVPKAKEKAGGGSSDEDEEDATLRQTDLSPTPNPTDDSTIPPAPNDSSLPRPPPINSLTANQSVPLLRTIFGLSSPSSIPLASSITFYDPTLNDSQREAVQFALESQGPFSSLLASETHADHSIADLSGRTFIEIACIHGPPGTGKTYTLVEIIMQLVKTRKQRVLVCGASNLSVGACHPLHTSLFYYFDKLLIPVKLTEPHTSTSHSSPPSHAPHSLSSRQPPCPSIPPLPSPIHHPNRPPGPDPPRSSSLDA